MHKGLFKFAETVNCLLLDVTGLDSGDSGHQFRVEITEVVLTRVGEPPITW